MERLFLLSLLFSFEMNCECKKRGCPIWFIWLADSFCILWNDIGDENNDEGEREKRGDRRDLLNSKWTSKAIFLDNWIHIGILRTHKHTYNKSEANHWSENENENTIQVERKKAMSIPQTKYKREQISEKTKTITQKMAPFLFIQNAKIKNAHRIGSIVSFTRIIRCHFCHEKGEKKHFHFYSCWCCFYVYICISLYLSYCFHSSAGKKRSIISFLKWFRSLHHSALEYICNFFPLFTLFSRIEAHWNANAITAFSIHLSCSRSFFMVIKMCSRVNYTRAEGNDTTKKCEEKKWNEMK